MVNVTISVDEDVLRRARIHALHQGTSVNALVRDYLENLVASDLEEGAIRRFLARARESRVSSGAGGRAWRREDLYES